MQSGGIGVMEEATKLKAILKLIRDLNLGAEGCGQLRTILIGYSMGNKLIKDAVTALVNDELGQEPFPTTDYLESLKRAAEGSEG